MNYKDLSNRELAILLEYSMEQGCSNHLRELLVVVVGRLDSSEARMVTKYLEIVRTKNKIAAIKEHRADTGSMLKDSKDYIDALVASHPEVKISDGQG